MKFPFWSAIALALLASCATLPEDERPQPISYQCSDIVVIGRLSNQQAREGVEIEGDLLGHGWFSALLTVKRHLAGASLPRRMEVRYFGHTYLRNGRDLMVILRKAHNGNYEIDMAHLMSLHPRLANRCD